MDCVGGAGVVVLGRKHRVVELGLRHFVGGSSLVDSRVDIVVVVVVVDSNGSKIGRKIGVEIEIEMGRTVGVGIVVAVVVVDAVGIVDRVVESLLVMMRNPSRLNC